jgi:hypothetical protein
MAKFPVLDLEGPSDVKLSLEERYATLLNVYKFQYFAIFRHIGVRWGWEAANDIADEMAAEGIPVIARGYQRKFDLPGEGAALVSQVLTAEFQVEGGDVEVLVENEEEAEYKVLCSFGDALQSGKFDNVKITDGLCTRGCWGWTQRLSDTVKPGLKVDRLTWMGNGAPRCHFTIKPAPAEEPAVV